MAREPNPFNPQSGDHDHDLRARMVARAHLEESGALPVTTGSAAESKLEPEEITDKVPMSDALAAGLGESRPRSARRRHHRSRERRPEQPIKESIEHLAQEFFNRVRPKLYEIVYDLGIKTTDDSGTEINKPEEDWSFAAVSLDVAQGDYAFNYNPDDLAKAQRGERIRPRKATPDQSIGDHQKARVAMIQLLTNRWQADRARIEAIITELNTAAEASGDKEKFLAARVKRYPKDKGIELNEAVTNWINSLENQRWLALMEAVDWFGARVRQERRSKIC